MTMRGEQGEQPEERERGEGNKVSSQGRGREGRGRLPKKVYDINCRSSWYGLDLVVGGEGEREGGREGRRVYYTYEVLLQTQYKS